MIRRPVIARAVYSIALLAVVGCGGGESVNSKTLGKAQALWDAAKIRNYNLEWTTSGDREGHYLVFVRDGVVKEIHEYLEDRRERRTREILVKPGDPSYYSVEGLFKIIREEQAMSQESDSPFGQPKGTQMLLKFTPDPEYGYPKRYRRDVVGRPKGLALDVTRFEPTIAPIPNPTG
jgi:hypothetical protein